MSMLTLIVQRASKEKRKCVLFVFVFPEEGEIIAV